METCMFLCFHVKSLHESTKTCMVFSPLNFIHQLAPPTVIHVISISLVMQTTPAVLTAQFPPTHPSVSPLEI